MQLNDTTTKPLYSGAPDPTWVPSSRVFPPRERPVPAPAPPPAAPVAAAPVSAPPARMRDQLRASASRFKQRHKLAFEPAAEPVLREPPAWSQTPALRPLPLPARTAATNGTATAGSRRVAIPLVAPIGTSVSVAPAQIVAELEPAPALELPVAEAPAPVVEVAPEPAVEVAPEPEPVETMEAVVPVAAAPAAPEPEVVAPREVSWKALVLSGPAGSGKSSVAHALAQVLPKTALVRVEPMRDRAFSTVVGYTLAKTGTPVSGSGPLPAIWTGPTGEAREEAIKMVRGYTGDGVLVIVEDTIENAAELLVYLNALADLNVKAVTLMPSLEEMERRDRIVPVEAQLGLKLNDARNAMIRQLKEASLLLDTSEETVESTTQRIFEALP